MKYLIENIKYQWYYYKKQRRKHKMTTDEFLEKLNIIQKTKCETRTLEIKSAHQGCPKHLYDSLSSFSNQDEGGIIIFGIDENNDYEEVGVYDVQDLQQKVNAQAKEMEPIVRPLFTVVEKNGLSFVSAEIPPVDLAERPCFYRGVGRFRGSYVRVGDSDEPMTEYEVYSYEAYRKKYQDDIRVVSQVDFGALNQSKVNDYLLKLKDGKKNLSNLEDETIFKLMNIKRDEGVTLASTLLFSPYPQAYFPQLCIIAIVVPGNEIGDIGAEGERFIDNQRIEGTIPDMLNEALAFVRKNMKTKTLVNSQTGEREDKTDYPIPAIREALLNALVHRDYSIHTEGKPIQVQMFTDRIEIISPGGLYGRIQVNQLGKIQPDTRNPVIATALEVMHVTENRYSGIPTIRRELKLAGLPEPLFSDNRDQFKVVFRKENITTHQDALDAPHVAELIEFCRTPRTRHELAAFLGLTSITYAIQRHVMPLVDAGLIKMSYPDKPKSSKQRFYSNKF